MREKSPLAEPPMREVASTLVPFSCAMMRSMGPPGAN